MLVGGVEGVPDGVGEGVVGWWVGVWGRAVGHGKRYIGRGAQVGGQFELPVRAYNYGIMLKGLAVLAIILTGIQTPLPVHENEHHQQAHAQAV